jgi:hypothetical protein
MGEAKRSQTRQVIIAGEPRCIYCLGPAATLEHMPPIGMFRDRQRPDAMVYCACKACNNGTRGPDAVAALIARMHPDNGEESWQTKEFGKLISAIDTCAPGVREEMSLTGKFNHEWMRRPYGNKFEHIRNDRTSLFTSQAGKVDCRCMGPQLHPIYVRANLGAD